MKFRVFFLLLIIANQSIGQVTPLDSASISYKSFGKSFKNDSTLSFFRSKKGYVPTLIHNLGYQATFPLRMKGTDFILLGATVVGTLVLINYDQEIDNQLKHVKADNPFINDVSPHVTEFGDYYGYILVAGIGSYSLVMHDYRLFRASLMASQAAITAGLWIRVGKMLSSRMRPEATYTDKEFNSDHWFGPFAQFGSHRSIAAFDAFPSGHTGAAFAMATAFSKEYSDYKAVPITLYSFATIVGVTRIIEHTHWASDVFLGAIIGYFCGKQVYENEKRLFPNYKNKEQKTLSYIYPFSENGAYGIGWKLVY